MNRMKLRITSGWNWARIIYLVLGVFVIIQSLLLRQWAGVALGAWFAAMGLLGLGCAAGNCYSPNNNNHNKNTKNSFITNETYPVKNGYEDINGV